MNAVTTALWQRPAHVLKAMLDAGDTSSVAIVESLMARADTTQPQINGFTRQRREAALDDAARLDAERASGAVRGLLHGLPITVKDNIDVAGLPTTVGLRHGADLPVTRDAVIVAQARAQGALVLGKSNVPQALMAMHCDNRLYGPARNPRSAAHVTGGSSAGEGALIASGASLMGLGTDLGGSIRFPAAFCGCVGFKPTQDRWSNRGIATGISGQEFVRSQVGPMARTVADIDLLMRALPATAQSAFDRRVPPLPDAPPPALDGMRIGMFLHDGFITPTPAMQRAVQTAAEALTRAGATIVPHVPVHQAELVELYLGAISSDALATARQGFAGEAPTAGLRMMWALGTLPSPVRRGLAAGLHRLGEPRLAHVVRTAGRKSIARLWQMTARRVALLHAIEDTWRAQTLDAVICPAAATPAVPIDMAQDAGLIFSYFSRFNVLGMPAGVVPVTRVSAQEAPMRAAGDRVDRRIAAISARSTGLPVAVQVVAPRWHDRTALVVMAAIEAAADPGVGTPVEVLGFTEELP